MGKLAGPPFPRQGRPGLQATLLPSCLYLGESAGFCQALPQARVALLFCSRDLRWVPEGVTLGVQNRPEMLTLTEGSLGQGCPGCALEGCSTMPDEGGWVD